MNKPTDAEIDEFLDSPGNINWVLADKRERFRLFARAVLTRWGQPAHSGEPVEPDFYTACALYEGGGEGGWIALPGYSNETEHGVKHLVLEAARKEDWKGTATGRLMALGWEIRPVYLAPQPVVREPLTDEQIDALDLPPSGTATVRDLVRIIEAAHGIKGGQHGADN